MSEGDADSDEGQRDDMALSAGLRVDAYRCRRLDEVLEVAEARSRPALLALSRLAAMSMGADTLRLGGEALMFIAVSALMGGVPPCSCVTDLFVYESPLDVDIASPIAGLPPEKSLFANDACRRDEEGPADPGLLDTRAILLEAAAVSCVKLGTGGLAVSDA